MQFDVVNILSRVAALFVLSAASAAFGATFTVGGTLSGLATGKSVTLLDNGASPLKLTANGKFSFAKALAAGAAYDVTVSIQPAGQSCSVTGATGKVASANITSVLVKCAPAYTIGGAVTGLAAKESVTLLDNKTNPLVVKANGAFTFSKALPAKSAYDVTVSVQPAGETCTVTGAKGTVAAANIKTVKVTCAAKTYSVGGNLSGLNSGATVTLLNNGANALAVKANGAFTFTKQLPGGASYDVTVGTQPAGQTCTVTGGSGKVAAANVKSVLVTCKTSTVPTYSVGGSVTGLNSGASVTLTLNQKDPTTVSSNTSFTFTTRLANSASYNVQVSTQPTGETCSVAGGVGTIASANVSVKVTCSASSGGANSPFWIPFVEAPDSFATGGGGVNGLAVLPSGSLTSSPNLDTVATGALQVTDFAYLYDLSSGTPTYIPQYIIYLASDKNGNIQLYKLSLVQSVSAPTPVQLGNIAVPSTQSVCRTKLVQTDLTDPTSFFVLLDIGTTNCNGLSDTFEVVHFADSSTTSPAVVSVTNADLNPLYSDGKLSGMVLYEPGSGNVLFFADDTFTNPKTLFSNVYNEDILSVGALRKLSTFSSEGLFIAIQPNASAPETLYRIDDSGNTASIMTLANATTYFQDSGTGADNNIYFFTYANSSTPTETLYQVPAAGGSPTTLFQKQVASSELISLIGSNDSDVVFQDNLAKTSTAAASVTLYSVPVGKTSTSATALNATAYPGTSTTVSSFMASPSLTDLSDAEVFVDIANVTVGPSSTTTQYSSIALQPGSTSSATPAANSVYGAFGTLGSAATGLAWQITGITDTNGGMGGGALNLTDVTTLTNTPLTTTGGKDFVVPAGYHSLGRSQGSLTAISSTGIAGGILLNENEKTVSGSSSTNKYGAIALAIDLNQGFILPVEVPATDVETF